MSEISALGLQCIPSLKGLESCNSFMTSLICKNKGFEWTKLYKFDISLLLKFKYHNKQDLNLYKRISWT